MLLSGTEITCLNEPDCKASVSHKWK